MSESIPQTENDLDRLHSAGQSAFLDGRTDDAERIFRRILELDPSHIGALNDLAVLRHRAGDLDGAELFFLRAAILGGVPADALCSLSAVAQQRGQMPEAALYLERALAVGGETPTLLDQMANLTEGVGDLETARGLRKKARDGIGQPPPPWRAACTEVDITPPLDDGHELQGYFGPPRHPDRVESPLKMQLLLLEDATGHRAFFISADIFGFGPELMEAINGDAQIWGVSPAAVVANASHTHYGPGTVTHAVPGLGTFHHPFAAKIARTIAVALPELYQSLTSCTLFAGQADAQIGFNRRISADGKIVMAPNPKAHYETATPFLRVELADGHRVLLVNHACHPTGLGPAKVISADYPGAMRDGLVERGAADTVMFLQGAAGDIKQGAEVDGRVGWIASQRDVETLGDRLAAAVAGAQDSAQPVVGTLGAVAQSVVAPLTGTPSGTAALSLPENADVPKAIIHNWAQVVEKRYPGRPTGLEYTVSALTIGNVGFLSIPGEPMAITANRMRGLNTHHDQLFVLGYTNGLAAYFPADEMVAQGGYEAHVSQFVYSLPSRFAEGVEDGLLSAAQICSAAVSPVLNWEGQKSIEDHGHRAFFVMSTGRSGTQTLAHLLKMATNAKVWHHPQPYMIMETQKAYWDAIDKAPVFWSGRGKIVREAWDNGLIHGETDHNMTPFCDEIAAAVPGSKFLILVRDPREFVRSGMRRNYFRGTGSWELGRLRPKEGDPRSAEWAEKEQFDQVCWLWAETYRHIERMRSEIGEDRVMVLRFEDLIAGVDATRALFEFLELDGYHEDETKKILGQKLNAQQVGTFPHPAEWDAELHDRCWAEVGEIAPIYGYEKTYKRRR